MTRPREPRKYVSTRCFLSTYSKSDGFLRFQPRTSDISEGTYRSATDCTDWVWDGFKTARRIAALDCSRSDPTSYYKVNVTGLFERHTAVLSSPHSMKNGFLTFTVGPAAQAGFQVKFSRLWPAYALHQIWLMWYITRKIQTRDGYLPRMRASFHREKTRLCNGVRCSPSCNLVTRQAMR